MPLSVKREVFESDWRFLYAVYERLLEKAKSHTGGVFDPDAFSRVLRPIEDLIDRSLFNYETMVENDDRVGDRANDAKIVGHAEHSERGFCVKTR